MPDEPAGTGKPAMTGARPEPPRRVRVTHPRMDEVRRQQHRAVTREIDEQTDLGEVYVRALVRSQLRLAVLICLIATVLLAGLAVVFGLSPGLGARQLLGIPLAWLVLGVLIYPALIALAVYAVRRAEGNEAAFIALVRRR